MHALRRGDCFTIRDALRKKGLDEQVRSLLAQMQFATQDVEGSATERCAAPRKHTDKKDT